MAKVSWREVPLTHEDDEREADFDERIEVMREYRQNGDIHKWLLCTPSQLRATGREALAVMGPKPSEIDFTGLDEAEA